MLRGIESPGQVPGFLARVKSAHERLLGFGHWVYKTYDPRARVLRRQHEQLYEHRRPDPLFSLRCGLGWWQRWHGGFGRVMSFRVLGPVEAWSDQRRLVLGGPQQVTLLAFLLLNANRALSTDAVIDAVGGAKRDGAIKRLHMGVLRLRKALAPLDADDEPRLRTVSGGYLLSVGPGELDSEVFADQMRDGRRSLEDGDPARASEMLTEVLALWRGPPLAEVAFEDFAQAEIRHLQALRLVALEARIDADLQLGRHTDLIPELEGLLAEHPTRDRIAAHLMTALYRSGRQADALEVYQRSRTQLAEQLGLEPGPALRALQAQILDQAPALQAVFESHLPLADAANLAALRSVACHTNDRSRTRIRGDHPPPRHA
jgi:DNA-binding SARP family transcriptional activator